MKEWKVTIECNHNRIDKVLLAETYSEAYIIAMSEYPDCLILSISQIRP